MTIQRGNTAGGDNQQNEHRQHARADKILTHRGIFRKGTSQLGNGKIIPGAHEGKTEQAEGEGFQIDEPTSLIQSVHGLNFFVHPFPLSR